MMMRGDLWRRYYDRCFGRIYHRPPEALPFDEDLAAIVDAVLERTGATEMSPSLCDRIVRLWRAG
jgi:hypothetical protein